MTTSTNSTTRKHQKPGQFAKKLTLYFHCITLTLFCQYFYAFFGVLPANATSSEGQNSQISQIAQSDQNNIIARSSSSSKTTTPTYNTANNFTFDDYTADYYLSRDADGTSRLRVVETFTAIFPSYNQNHGFTRVIPFTNQNGQNLTMASDKYLKLELIHNGIHEEPYEVTAEDGYFSVKIGDPDEYVHDTQIYTLKYEFENVITDFDEDGETWQELYWDTNGNDNHQRWNTLSARVHFEDPEIAAAYADQAKCYVGRYGESGSDRCRIIHTDDGLEFQTSKLYSGENLSYVIKFQPNTFAKAKLRYNYFPLICFIIELGIGIVLIIISLHIAHKVKDKRNYYKSYFVKPEYSAPGDISVSEMAKNYLHSSTISTGKLTTAQLLSMAVAGKVELIKREEKSRFGKSKTVWVISTKIDKFTKEEALLLQILAGGEFTPKKNQEITIKSHKATNTLIKLGKDYIDQINTELRAKDLADPKVNNPDVKKHLNPAEIISGCAAGWLFAGLVASLWLFDSNPSYLIVVGGWQVIACIVIFWIANFVFLIVLGVTYSPFFTHTKKGLEYSRHMDGLKMYIKLAEAERIKLLQSVKGADTSHQGIVKLYEKLLPYAVVLGLEKSWLNEMSKYYAYDDVKDPNWYVGVGAFSVADFSSNIANMSSSIATTTLHSTTSSSSSGGSGFSGGFSGGGGGGGGTSGW